MKADAFLSQIQLLDKKIRNKRIELSQIKSLTESVSCPTDSERVQKSRNLEGFAKHIPEIIELENEINQMVWELVKVRKEIIDVIELSLSDPLEYDVIHLNYVQGMKLTKICDQLGHAYSHIWTVKNNALKHIQETLDKKE